MKHNLEWLYTFFLEAIHNPQLLYTTSSGEDDEREDTVLFQSVLETKPN